MADRQDEIFISYSRQNSDFVKQFVAELGNHNIDPWFDMDDIPKSREWWREIQKGIEGANAFVFIISADSLQSQVCNWELAHALNLSKKIIPVLYEDVFANKDLLAGLSNLVWENPDSQQINANDNWKRVADLNFVRYCDDTNLVSSVDEIVTTARTDFDHREQHTTLGFRASEWEQRAKDSGFLLIENELKVAQEWLDDADGKEPPPTELHKEFIQASQIHNQTLRRIRWAAIGGSVVAVIAIVVSLIAGQNAIVSTNQVSTSEAEVINAQVQVGNVETQVVDAQITATSIVLEAEEQIFSRELARQAQVIFNDGDHNLGLSLAVEANLISNPPLSSQNIFAKLAYQPAQRRQLAGHTGRVYSVAFSPDGSQIVSGSEDNRLILWDVASGEIIHRFEGHTSDVNSVAFSPDGSQIVSGSYDKTLILWDVANSELVHRFEGHTLGVRSVAFSPDGSQIVSGSYDKTLILWDVASSELVRRFRGHISEVNGIAFSPDGSQIVSASGHFEYKDNQLILWDVASGEIMHRFEGADISHVFSVAFSPDGSQIVSGSEDEGPILWDVASGELMRRFEGGHTSWVLSVAFSPDGSQIISGARDKTLILWDTETGKLLRRYPSNDQTSRMYALNSVAFSPDGSQIISGSDDQTLILWDVISGELVQRFEEHTAHVNSVVFSPDGSQIVSGSDDQTLILWDVETSGLLRRYPDNGHTSSVNSVAFSPDDSYIVSGSSDKTLILWDAASGEMVRRFRGLTLTR
jgi:WD40 repeat protein